MSSKLLPIKAALKFIPLEIKRVSWAWKILHSHAKDKRTKEIFLDETFIKIYFA